MGQTDPQVKFLTKGRGYSLYLTEAEAVFTLKRAEKNNSPQGLRDSAKNFGRKPQTPKDILKTAPQEVLRLRLEGGNRKSEFEAADELPGKSNYFIGNDHSKWHTDIAHYAKVKMKDVYPGVDMVYYGNQRKLEYDFVVKPGADPKVIKFSYEGAQNAEVDGQGNLQFHMNKGNVPFTSPTVYQMKDGQTIPVEGRYEMGSDQKISFIVGIYDKTLPLVIDPQLDYSTYLGGNGQDGVRGIAVDGSGNAYVTGWTTGGFPITSGAYQTVNNGMISGNDCVFITEMNSSGTDLVYSTYLGGSGGDIGNGIALDGAGNAYVTGSSNSTDFPTTSGVYQTAPGSGFLTKINALGNGLVYSTYLSGSCSGIALDGSGNAYVVGAASADFPTTNGAYQTTSGGCFFVKLNSSGTNLLYSTYIGGSAWIGANGIALDGSGNAYITGYAAQGFPTTSGAFQTALGNYYTAGGENVFVMKLNPAGGDASDLVYSTYLGGSYQDWGYGIAVDGSGCAYVTGFTSSIDFPAAHFRRLIRVEYLRSHQLPRLL